MIDPETHPQEFLEQALKIEISQSIMDDLIRFESLVREGNSVMNLVGPSTLSHFWSRHVLDSLQLVLHAPETQRWADIGAGAGFPGVVLAIWLKHQAGLGKSPQIYLIDSLQKRCRFLETCVDQLSLPASVHWGRAECFDFKVEAVTARAVASLPKLLSFAQSLMKTGADAWFLKSEGVDAELIEARKQWRFNAETLLSLSDPRGRILHIQGLRHV